MATSRPRHLITETDDVARALNDAAQRWPHERSRSRLLIRLAEAGHQALKEETEQRAEKRRAAIARTTGLLSGMYGSEYLATLREDWPG